MSARELAIARATAMALGACVNQLALRLVDCSEEDKKYLWGELSHSWQQLASVALTTSPSVDETTDDNIIAEVMTLGSGHLHYPADNFIECLMALTQEPHIQSGDAHTVFIMIPGGQQ